MSRRHAADKRLSRPTPGRLVMYGFLGVLFVYIAVLFVEGVPAEARGARLRLWSLFTAGVFAVSVPHVLLPDPAWHLVQLVNRSPGRLLAHQLRPWSWVMALFLVPCLVLAYYDPGGWLVDLPEKSFHLLQAVLVIAGVGLYAFELYVTIGQVSQAWQEGRKGNLYRTINRNVTTPVALPPGMVPALMATNRIFVVGVLVVVAQALAGRSFGPEAAWVPGALLAGWAVLRLRREARVFDRHFYSTNAFYAEIFRSSGGVRVSDREPIPYGAVYWAPSRWRPHVWAGLRQLDRKLAMGRLVLLGHALLWVLFFQDAPGGVVAAYLLLFAAAKNAAVYLLTTDPFAPEPFQVTLQSALGWTLTRFLVNLRWTLPWLLSLGLVAAFEDAFTLREAALWTAVDVLLALGTAAAFTLMSESQYRKRYA